MLLFFLLSSIGAGSLALSDAHTTEVLSHLRSNALRLFPSQAHLHTHVNDALAQLMDESSNVHSRQHAFIVSLSEDENVSALKQLGGLHRFSIIGDTHFQVVATPRALKTLLAEQTGVVGVVPVVSAMKIDAALLDLSSDCHSNSRTRELSVEVAALSAEELQMFIGWLDVASMTADSPFSFIRESLIAEEQRYLKVSSACAHSLAIAHLLADSPEVLWVEEFVQMHTFNNWARGVMETGSWATKPLETVKGLTGKGQIIGVADTGLDMFSTYFYDNVTLIPDSSEANLLHRKVVSYTSKVGGFSYGDSGDDADTHGTHVCGIVAGKAYENYGDYKRFDGAAYDAKLAFFDIQIAGQNLNVPSNLDTDLFRPLYQFGARIMSNSWGETTKAAYDGKTTSTDKFMVNYPDSLILFAAGNSGDPEISGGASVSSVGSPATFKNGLTVGAGLNDKQTGNDFTFGECGPLFTPDAMAKFSSRGPTSDGRLKPEILAPGMWVTSARGDPGSTAYHTGVQGKVGTSMATPAAAAMAAIVRQYFTEGHYVTSGSNTNGFIPAGSLLKAMLIASTHQIKYVYSSKSFNAVEIAAGYPSNDQGYGQIKVSNVLHFGQASADPLNLFVIGDTNTESTLYREFNTTGQVHRYQFKVSEDKIVRVVMAYTDPTTGTSSTIVIINDIELTLTFGGNTVFSSQTYKNTFKVMDAIEAKAGVLYTVNLRAVKINAATKQPYSLVIVGKVSSVTGPASNNDFLQNVVPVDNIPFTAAIIAMSVICFFIFFAFIFILAINWCPSKSPTGYFRVIKW